MAAVVRSAMARIVSRDVLAMLAGNAGEVPDALSPQRFEA